MSEDLMDFNLPTEESSIIKVIGVGGGGSNAVNHMYKQGIKDVSFVVCNTDAQALVGSPIPVKIQLGESLTEGRGAGNKPEQGKQAAIENIEDVVEVLSNNTKMVFITAGMGGGTGTGAAPVIAQTAKELGILTVGIVTIPFRFEGSRRVNQALEGISELKKHVDSLLVINNEKLREIYGDLTLTEAFSRADNVLTTAAKGIAEIITVHGYINVDFADVCTVMSNSGVAIMGSAEASGEDRAINAIQEALTSPLLNNNNIIGANNILLNITSGSEEVRMDEIGQITDYVQDAAGMDADIIWGNGVDETLGENISVTIIATGFGTSSIPELLARDEKVKKKEVVTLDVDKAPKNVFELDTEVIEPSAQQTIKFDSKQKSKDSPVKNQPLYEEMYGETQTQEEVEVDPRVETLKRSADRANKVNELRNSDRINEIESVPAYIRKKIQLDQNSNKEDQEMSRYTLSDDDNEVRFSPDNSFLHDNVD